MEHITITKMRFNPVTRIRLQKKIKRFNLLEEITDDMAKFMMFATFLNVLAHSDKVLSLIERWYM
jgi:hypothetical protein